MDKTHIDKLSRMLDPQLWINPEKTIQVALDSQPGFDIFNPDTIKKSLLRAGTELTKEEKKKHHINPSAKVGTGIFDHFTPQALSDCVPLATELAYAISAIQSETDKIKSWPSRGVSKIIFEPAPDCCPICDKLRGTYKPADVPLPVLSTHLGCRCSLTCSAE